ncbi:biopolymer transporter ExbD [Nitratireductor sp. ZSWI3]|uniref:ExbD/TolR family protein n=1 Tax=Nitratireductor sp. ZSWI3 TaxID=2966359 RepID=UPI00214FE3FF|nr:biopolymer transporter ExbD [Nitratireductor sp. ZSWI3]MCR4267963.1 biopolymer transporter ExbD [Nitratireductor sp. ZSWI3]
MLRLARPRETRQRESTIALINIVFLMLIFFLVAGTLTPPLDNEIDLITTAEAERAEPPGALFATETGELRAKGEPVEAARFVAERRAETDAGQALEITVAADRDLPAARLVDIIGALKAAGAGKISIITERAAE